MPNSNWTDIGDQEPVIEEVCMYNHIITTLGSRCSNSIPGQVENAEGQKPKYGNGCMETRVRK